MGHGQVPFFPFFLKATCFPTGAVNKKPGIQVSGWKNGGNGGIRRYPENWILPGLAIRGQTPVKHPKRDTLPNSPHNSTKPQLLFIPGGFCIDAVSP
jgi:hypothetical protein